MPADRDLPLRRSVIPSAANRSLWLAAAWTGVGAALVCAVVAIAVVAICWLPASGGSGSAGSTIRGGILTFLAALHAGITVDGVTAAFVPLGMTVIVGVVAWRAGAGLADAADQLDEERPRRLAQAGVVQAAVFALVCAVAARVVTLGTSSAPVIGVAVAALVVFALTGGVAFVRGSALADEVADCGPAWLGPAIRTSSIGVAVYLAAGSGLVAAAVLEQHDRVETLSRQVGGGWSGAPVLLLGILAAPNAVIAAASYLAGPGFALGAGSGVSLGSTVHGTLPAFPILGAVPSGPATTPVWVLAVATPLVAGVCVAAAAIRHADAWLARSVNVVLGSVGTGFVGLLLAWQGGGAIGSGRLNAFGASPWRLGTSLAAAVVVAGAAALGVAAAAAWWRARRVDEDESAEAPGVVRTTLAAVASVVTGQDDDGTDETSQLAG
jgi:hypothetical protein